MYRLRSTVIFPFMVVMLLHHKWEVYRLGRRSIICVQDAAELQLFHTYDCIVSVQTGHGGSTK